MLVQARKHSGLGIAAFLIALLIGGLDLILAIIIATEMVGRTPFEAQEHARVGSIAIFFLHYVSLPPCIVGVGLGLVALIAHRSRNNLFSWIGLCGNGLVIISIVGLHVSRAIERTQAARQQQEGLRLQQEARRLQQEARRLEEEARYRQEEARRKEEDIARKKQEVVQKALDEHITQAKHALKANDVDAARKEIALAGKYKPHDVRITELKTELNYRMLVSEGNEFLAKDALEQSLASFQEALRIRPPEAIVQKTSSAIMQIQAANLYLQRAKNLLRDERLEDACNEGKKATEVAIGLANEFGKDSRFKATLRKLSNGTAERLQELFLSLWKASQADKENAANALSNNEFSAAIKDFRRASDHLATAKTFLLILNGDLFSGNVAENGKKTRELEAEIVAVDLNTKKAQGQKHVQTGKDLLKVGREYAGGAAKAPARLLAARTAFSEAVKQLELAKGLPETNAESQLQSARSEFVKVTQAIQPINVDFESSDFKAAWSYSQPRWLLKKQDAKAWFQTAPVTGARLKSPLLELPRDFDFQFEFAVLDAKGKVRNEQLSNYRSLLKVTLVARKASAANSVLDFGHEDTKLGHFASIEIDKKSYALGRFAKKEPIKVRLVRYNGAATVTFGSEKLASFPLSTDFEQVIFDVSNGLNYKQEVLTSVAIFGIALKLHVEN